MVGAVLRVVFEDEESGVVPIRGVRHGIDDAADGEIIVGNRCRRSGLALGEARGMVIGQTKQDELRHDVFARVSRGRKL